MLRKRLNRARMSSSGTAMRGTQRRAKLVVASAPSLRDLRNWGGAEYRRWLIQFVVLIFGLFLFALGLVLNLQSNLGASSWTVFQDGIARHSPLSIGQASQIVGVVMIAVSWLGGIRPGVGTVLNMYLVGLFMDLMLDHDVVPLAGDYRLRIAMLLASIAVLGIATGVYIKAGFGAGPRDSFNISVTEATGIAIGVTRWLIESTVVILGIILGGRFGPGTILAAFLIGPAVGVGFRLTGITRQPAPPAAEPADGQIPEGSIIIGEAESARD